MKILDRCYFADLFALFLMLTYVWIWTFLRLNVLPCVHKWAFPNKVGCRKAPRSSQSQNPGSSGTDNFGSWKCRVHPGLSQCNTCSFACDYTQAQLEKGKTCNQIKFYYYVLPSFKQLGRVLSDVVVLKFWVRTSTLSRLFAKRAFVPRK